MSEWVMPKKSLMGFGGFVIATAITLYASSWPEQVRAHPRIVIGIAVSGLIVLVWGLLIPSRPKSPTQLLEAGRDNSGSQFSAGRDIHFHEVPKQQAPIATASSPPSQPASSETFKYTLQILNPVFEQVCPIRGGWKARTPGILGAVSWVHNPTAEEGEIGIRFQSARASLAYRKQGNLLFTIESAYWLEESGYEIDLKPGMTRGIIIALFPAGTSSPFWFGSQNHRRDRITAPRPGQVLFARTPEYVNFAIPDEIEISIVSKQKTVRKVSILVESNDGSSYRFTLGKVIKSDHQTDYNE